MKLGSLFSGYGGLDQAVSAALGTSTVWVSDIDPCASKILAHNHRGTPNLGDITQIEWGNIEPVDVLTGGFPCQDLSSAGLRAGIKPGTRSGLWEHMAYAIQALKPRLVVIENVRGITSAPAHSEVEPCSWCLGDNADSSVRALGAVLSDLADLGYDARWHGLRASDVGAPHTRYRIFIVAYPHRTGLPRLQNTQGTSQAARGGHPIESIDAVAEVWGPFAEAIRRWELILGRSAPDVGEPRGDGSYRLSPQFSEWLMGLPEGWVTGVPGLPRPGQLQALGNGVVPQQAEAALRFLLGGESE